MSLGPVFAVQGTQVAQDGTYSGTGVGKESEYRVSLNVIVENGKIKNITDIRAKKAREYEKDINKYRQMIVGHNATYSEIDAIGSPTTKKRKYGLAMYRAVLDALKRAPQATGNSSGRSNNGGSGSDNTGANDATAGNSDNGETNSTDKGTADAKPTDSLDKAKETPENKADIKQGKPSINAKAHNTSDNTNLDMIFLLIITSISTIAIFLKKNKINNR